MALRKEGGGGGGGGVSAFTSDLKRQTCGTVSCKKWQSIHSSTCFCAAFNDTYA